MNLIISIISNGIDGHSLTQCSGYSKQFGLLSADLHADQASLEVFHVYTGPYNLCYLLYYVKYEVTFSSHITVKILTADFCGFLHRFAFSSGKYSCERNRSKKICFELECTVSLTANIKKSIRLDCRITQYYGKNLSIKYNKALVIIYSLFLLIFIGSE